MLKKSFVPEIAIFLITWLVLMIGGRSRFFHDPGTFWHTRVGNDILGSYGFFDSDHYTFTFAGERWIPHQWLGEIGMALAHEWNGFTTQLLIVVTVISLMFTWIGSRFLAAGVHLSLVAVFLALGISASSTHFHIRPHIITIVGMAVLTGLLIDLESQKITWKTWLMIPFFYVWGNIHGGVLGGLATFALMIFAWMIWSRIGWWRGPSIAYLIPRLIAIFVVSIIVILFNPYTYHLPESWLEIYRSKVLPEIIQEHARLIWTDLTGIMVASLAVIFVSLFVSCWPQRPKATWFIPLVWFVLASQRIRHAPLFAVTALVVIADIFPYSKFATYLERKGSDWFIRRSEVTAFRTWQQRIAFVLSVVIFLVTCLSLEKYKIKIPVLGADWVKLDPEIWPIDLLPDLRSIPENPERPWHFFNEFSYGGFLIFFTPQNRVFVDDRCELFGDSWLKDFVSAENNFGTSEFLINWQRDYGDFDYVLTRNESFFDHAFQSDSDHWKVVKSTPTANLLQRILPSSKP